MADMAVRVPADRIEIVEDAHMAMAHAVCVALGAERRRSIEICLPEDQVIDVGIAGVGE